MRGSLTTTLSEPTNWTASQERRSFKTASSSAASAVISQAAGRESSTVTRRARMSRVWKSTTQRGSLKPRGLVSSAFTSGWGTRNPSWLRMPVNKLVPLR